ncbi:MAG: hypothetical protein LC799_10480 [Actinobacteria bacterium]|nr:hypothetical protein [Actinomycetota bacterium]
MSVGAGAHSGARAAARRVEAAHLDELRLTAGSHWVDAVIARGRSGDALAAFRGYRDLLAEELGLDPSRQLADLQEAILQQGAQPKRAPPAVESPATSGRKVTRLRLDC